ncbi:MAG TPA: hypothetical protein VNN22_09570 [Verrucomicrobiae bacterium]|nr:hypothetical protein [Verrucomicrobiae bacterium]
MNTVMNLLTVVVGLLVPCVFWYYRRQAISDSKRQAQTFNDLIKRNAVGMAPHAPDSGHSVKQLGTTARVGVKVS